METFYWVIFVATIALLIAPLFVYMTVRMAVLGFYMARKRYNELYGGKDE